MLVPVLGPPLGQKLCGRYSQYTLVENHGEPAPSQEKAARESQFSVCGETEAQ